MFGRLFRRSNASPIRPRTRRLTLEHLEHRDVPSQLTVQVTYNQAESVTLSGNLSDPSVSTANQPVTLTGPIAGAGGGNTVQTMTDANGNYSVTLQMTASGSVNVQTNNPTPGQAFALLLDPSTSATASPMMTPQATVSPSTTASSMLTLQATVSQGVATISGTLSSTAGSPANQTVTITGPLVGASGTNLVQATTDNNGNYQIVVPLTGSGVLNAQAMAPSLAQASTPVSCDVTNGVAPTLTMQVSYVLGTEVTISGCLSGPTGGLANQLITITGPLVGNVGANTVQTMTDANGNYSITVQATGQGILTAQSSGQAAAMATTSLVDPNGQPTITQFSINASSLGYWVLQGTVQYSGCFDGLYILFGGQPVDIAGQTVDVGCNSTFELDVKLNGQASDNGVVSAVAIDAWGVQSNMAFDIIEQSGT